MLRIIGHFLGFVLLTLLTQIGGLLWLLSVVIARQLRSRWTVPLLTVGVFVGLYLAATCIIVPPLARRFGRVPLPVYAQAGLRPESVWFRLLNRTYVRPALLQAVVQVADQMQAQYPGSVMLYLDAGFPFINGYPLTGHFSHDDGQKIDIALYWNDAATQRPLLHLPSPFGYGVCAEPLAGEYDYNQVCREKGHWYIDVTRAAAKPFFKKEHYRFDAEKTREMARLFAENPAVGKILLEPHLKTRLRLEQYRNIRAQGCHAARHDDHAHVQL